MGRSGWSEYATVNIEEAKVMLARVGAVNPGVCALFDPFNPRRVAKYTTMKTSAALAVGISASCRKSTRWSGRMATGCRSASFRRSRTQQPRDGSLAITDLAEPALQCLGLVAG